MRTFLTFDDSGGDDKNLVRVLHGPLNQHAEELHRLNDRGAGVFFVVNETDGVGIKKDNITAVRGVFADLDGAPLEPVLEYILPPHLVVETSPGKFHAYWRVHLPLQLFTGVQKTIAARFNSDPSICNLNRVMRMPGFWHRKATPFLSRIIQDVPGTYSSETIIEHFPPTDEAPRSPHGLKPPATVLDIWIACEALKVIPCEVELWPDWNDIGMATYCATDGDDEGKKAFVDWTNRFKKFDRQPARRWEHYHKYPPNQFTLGTLVMLARLVEPDFYERVMYELLQEEWANQNASL